MSTKNEAAQSMELVVVQTAITKMDALSQGLKDLAKKHGGVIFDVKTTKGMADAKAARREIAEPRIAVEKVRKEAKAPILELGRKLDAEAARITKELSAIEDPIAAQITNEEQRVERERQAIIAREQQRDADITTRIQTMRNAVGEAARMRTSVEVARFLAEIQRIAVDLDHFAEFMETAALAKREAVSEIERIRDEMLARETEAEQLRKDREELNRQRAEQEARDKVERDRQAAETAAANKKLADERAAFEATQAEERARVAADNARIAAVQRAAQEAIDKSNRELEARQQAERDAQAERDREAEQRRQDAEREAEERRVAEEQEAERQRIANYRPTFDEIVAIVAANYNRTPDVVRTWIKPVKEASQVRAA